MKQEILNKIEEMNKELIEEWNKELDRFFYLKSSKEKVEHNMDIIEGKSVILEQLKEYIEKM